MVALHKVSAIVFFVKDLQRTTRFYADALGISLEMIPSDHETLATADLGDMAMVFIESDEKPGRSPVVVFGLDGNIDGVVEGLVEQGVEIVTPVSHAPDGGLTADFLDPDDHVLSVYQPAGAPRGEAK